MIYAGMFYIATLLLVVGLGYKIFDYSRTPAPLKIPTTPAPTTQKGVVYRMAKEVVLFESLFKSNKWIWVFGWLFHFGLFLVLARHLRYFTEPVWFWVGIVQPFGKYASIMMVIGLAGLLARRFLVDRVRYISTPSDYLMLVLLLAIGLSGMLMTRRAYRHRGAESLHGPDKFDRSRCRRTDPAGPPCHGGAADGDLPDQQAAARARRILQPHAQPGR
jgi:nitrate reductase gamma subunit